MAEKLNNYFENAAKTLNIAETKEILTPVTGIYDPIDIAIKKYENNPSILLRGDVKIEK